MADFLKSEKLTPPPYTNAVIYGPSLQAKTCLPFCFSLPVRTSPLQAQAYKLPPPLAGPVLALGSMAVTIQGIGPSGVITTTPAPAFQACQSLFLRRRAHQAAPVSDPATQMMQACTFHMMRTFPQPHLFSPGLLDLLKLVRKPSTLNGHAPYFQKWQAFCHAKGIPYLPATPLAVANFLFESASGDSTASPTLNRCGAISFFCHMAGAPNPMAHPFCVQVKFALLRKLGLIGAKKLPLLQSQLLHILHIQLVGPHTLPTLLQCFHMALMYEGCLRWHDLAQLFFGDIIITKSFLRLFIQSAKTDTYRQGQWITIAASTAPYSVCQLLHRILAHLTHLWALVPGPSRAGMLDPAPAQQGSLSSLFLLPLQDVPVTFAFNNTTALPCFNRVVSYPQFLACLKKWGAAAGLNPQYLGTHSLRRGLASDWALQGVPDRLRREHGRWRSAKVADGYIDASINIQLLLHAVNK